MRRMTHCDLQKSHPARSPFWRWSRANDLIEKRRNFSKKRDDLATGVAVRYLRESAKSFSDKRIRRIRTEFRHIVSAQEIWQEAGRTRLELESRILTRQTDLAIHYEMQLAAETVQAYRDLFYDLEDRIGADKYILYGVLRVNPEVVPSAIQLLQMSAYFHGPEVIDPWLRYLKNHPNRIDLKSPEGRTEAAIDVFVKIQQLPNDEITCRSLVTKSSFWRQQGVHFTKSMSASSAFEASTAMLTQEVRLPSTQLPALAYAPAEFQRKHLTEITSLRKTTKAA